MIDDRNLQSMPKESRNGSPADPAAPARNDDALASRRIDIHRPPR
jgi:hypothetical protein